MNPAPGLRLGPFEFLAPLGAGGMGEVWHARDTRLDREVAIKLLPAGVAADPERLARFEREARVLAALQHPHVAGIYGLHDEGGVRFLALELVPGEDLAQRLTRGPLGVDEAIDVARQIAAGVEVAHERGIVHRDLKPANVKLTPTGQVKVLDFGLAKALDAAGSLSPDGGDATASPTITSLGSVAGMILGTAAYMSPEQARGKTVDRRADIWAFGALVYELLSGRRAFEGETISDTLAAVLKTDPDWSALPADTPPALRRLLARCLDRDPQMRLRDIGEARVLLSGSLEAPAPAAPEIVAGKPPSRIGWLLFGLAALAVGLVAGRQLLAPKAPQAGLDMRFALAIPDGLTLQVTGNPPVALSRDGRYQVVSVLDASAVPRLLLRRDDELEPRFIPDTNGAVAPFFSPDGSWVAFFRDGGLFKIPVAGGPPVRLASTMAQVRGGVWSRDGFIYFSPDSQVGISRVPENGGAVEPVTHLDEARNERTHRWPEALPDGSAILFTSDTAASTEYYDDARIEAVRPATGERKVVIDGASQARCLPDGRLVIARGGSLFAVEFDVRSLTTRGTPVSVAEGVATDATTGAVAFSLSETGSALWIPGGATIDVQHMWVDRAGAESSVSIASAPYSELALSPDGRRVALVGGQGGVADLWVADIERGSLTRLTFGEFVASPVWTPDGTRVAYSTSVQGKVGNLVRIAWKPADGSRDAETLVEAERGRAPSSFSPDGRTLVFDAYNATAGQRDIFLLPLDGERKPRPLLEGPFLKTSGVVSPDGRWLAYVSNEGVQSNVYVRPFPAGEGRWQISTPQGTEPRWRSDGRELFYRARGVLYAVAVDATHGFSAGPPQRLFDRVANGAAQCTYGPAPDGRRFFTFRAAEAIGANRTVYLDLNFARQPGR